VKIVNARDRSIGIRDDHISFAARADDARGDRALKSEWIPDRRGDADDREIGMRIVADYARRISRPPLTT